MAVTNAVFSNADSRRLCPRFLEKRHEITGYDHLCNRIFTCATLDSYDFVSAYGSPHVTGARRKASSIFKTFCIMRYGTVASMMFSQYYDDIILVIFLSCATHLQAMSRKTLSCRIIMYVCCHGMVS